MAETAGTGAAGGRAPESEKTARPQVDARQLLALVQKYARKYAVEERLVWAVMSRESGFNPSAVSPKGALGLMQLMPDTAVLMGVTDPFDIEQNIAGGIKYLGLCLSRFNQDMPLALAAYNAGPENVMKYQGCPPFPETVNYVAAVLREYGGRAGVRKIKAPSLEAASAEEPDPSPKNTGLKWRVSSPEWKISKPQMHIQDPLWKTYSLAPHDCQNLSALRR